VVIDPLSIFSEIEEAERRDICQDFLGSMLFENPNIVKIFHGGINGPHGDLGWLQRDFGIMCVNVFDTQEFFRVVHQSNLSDK